MPRAMSVALIDEIIAGAGEAARRLARPASTASSSSRVTGSISDFLNPRKNLRTDAYGGSSENRLRFLRDLLAEVRNGLVTAPWSGLRISADEMEPSGIDEDEALADLSGADAKRAIDYVHVTSGSSRPRRLALYIAPPMAFAHAYLAPYAGTLRAAVGKPVFVAGRINQPQDAEAVIAAARPTCAA